MSVAEPPPQFRGPLPLFNTVHQNVDCGLPFQSESICGEEAFKRERKHVERVNGLSNVLYGEFCSVFLCNLRDDTESVMVWN